MRRLSQRYGVSTALATLLVAGSVRAGASDPERGVEVSVDSRVGQATAPYFTRAFPTTSGYGASLVLGARLRVADHFRLGLRVPLVLMRVEQPAGALYAEAAWANPELSVAFERPWVESEGRILAFGARLAMGAPLAEHDPAQLEGRALRLASALEGFSEPGLYVPGVFPITPGAGLDLTVRRFRFLLSLELPLLFRVSRDDLPPESDARSFAFTPVAMLEARWRVLGWLSVAASSRLTAQAIAPVEDHAAPLQLLAAGRVEFHLGEGVSLSALVQAPVGGPLGGSTVAGGIGFRVEL